MTAVSELQVNSCVRLKAKLERADIDMQVHIVTVCNLYA